MSKAGAGAGAEAGVGTRAGAGAEMRPRMAGALTVLELEQMIAGGIKGVGGSTACCLHQG